MFTRVLQPKQSGPLDRRIALRLAAAWLACACAAGCAAAQGVDVSPPGAPPVAKETEAMNAPAAMIEAALADAANRSTAASADIKVVTAEAVTWPDGSLGCPQPGMLYTQALVTGYRIVLQAGDLVLNYHSAARGKPVFCPASRVAAPVPAGTNPAV
jgi:hypothetical protein